MGILESAPHSFRCLSDQRLRPQLPVLDVQAAVSDACQIKDLDHIHDQSLSNNGVSDACQIKDLDHINDNDSNGRMVSDACQIKDLDHQTGTFGHTT